MTNVFSVVLHLPEEIDRTNPVLRSMQNVTDVDAAKLSTFTLLLGGNSATGQSEKNTMEPRNLSMRLKRVPMDG